MRYFLFVLIINTCSAQRSEVGHSKLLISPSVYSEWRTAKLIDFSLDASYVSFTKGSLGTHWKSFYIIDTRNDRTIELRCAGRSWFTPDSRFAIWMLSPDSLCIMSLADFKLSCIPNVGGFWLYNNCLIYKLRNPKDVLVLKNMATRNTMFYSSVSRFWLSEGLKSLVLLRKHLVGGQPYESIELVDMIDGKETSIWSGSFVGDLVVDSSGSQICFMANDTLWHYKSSKGTVPLKTRKGDDSIIINRLIGFSRDGDRLFMSLGGRDDSPVADSCLNLWDYSDFEMTLQQIGQRKLVNILAVVSFSDQVIHSLQSSNEVVYFPGPEKAVDTICLISRKRDFSKDTSSRLREYNQDWELLYTKNGNRRKLDFINGATVVLMSPSGKYVVYYDRLLKNYFTYEIATEKIRSITSGLKENWEKYPDDGIYGYKYICGWVEGDRKLLIYGKNDIWEIDPIGVKAPIRLTNGYGSRHNLRFFLALEEYSYRFLGEREKLILTAFNPLTKDNGFYRIELGKSQDPDSLTIGPYLYCISENPWLPAQFNFPPVKSKFGDKYLVRRMSVIEAPNYYLTSDFKTFKVITNIQPQKEYNWYSSELHSWRSLDGSTLQGILYKPENFDSSISYPVIFSFYERMSDRLYSYMEPEALTGGSSLNIPYYVSNGYLVFCPDIYYRIGDPMKGTYDAIISAVDYLSGLSYVNSKKIGIQGSSWGAIQTNYLITHTNLFAAACSVSGLSDWISGYGSLMLGGESSQDMYEKGQLRVGASLWGKPNIYIKNSAVLNADKVTTPLLMMHTTNDELCAFSNALELFTALRRLGQRCWLLEYGGNHTLLGDEAEDFSVRMKQFFDHYLMSKPARKWMTQPTPIYMKSGDVSLELDDNVRTPGSGLNVK
ncbi:dienelactone hydrolase [Chitinophaga sp. W2I13]|uniref:alpha/beta hydrolase family protein n=1 Tax=Chitinophaga sp. W2I13 TaxID=3373923 RepID=UPI003D1E8F7F